MDITSLMFQSFVFFFFSFELFLNFLNQLFLKQESNIYTFNDNLVSRKQSWDDTTSYNDRERSVLLFYERHDA